MNRRRSLLLASAAGLTGVLVVRPAKATRESLQAAVRAFTGGAPLRTAPGRVLLDIAPLVENGNTVPVTVRVASPMTPADHVQRIALFNERNPQAEVAVFHLSPRNGSAVVSMRMRLATSQQVLAVALMSDGTYWQQAVDVVVTLAACIE
jgi:sulfur-oxidizing protein SoxY